MIKCGIHMDSKNGTEMRAVDLLRDDGMTII